MSFTVYRSSAGSGKTYTLVKEYLKLVLQEKENNRYKSILAITFTNKAASEMKERVIAALTTISGNNRLEGTARFLLNDLISELNQEEAVIQKKCGQVLSSMLHNYSDISISTIDKFVHKIVRTFAYDLQLPVNFSVEMDSENLLQLAIDFLISKVGSNAELTRVLLAFSEQKANDEKSWNIEEDLKNFAYNLLKEQNSSYLRQLKNLSLQDFFSIRKQIDAFLTNVEDDFEKLGNTGLAIIAKNNLEIKDFSGGAKNGIGKYFSSLSKRANDKYSPSPSTQANFEAENWAASKANATTRNSIDACRSELSIVYQNAQNQVALNYPDYKILTSVKANIYALSVLNEIEKVIDEIKRENNQIHISEFNQKIAGIVLHEPVPFIYERIGERYKNYLIDEFQDTSVMQWQNFIPLLENSLGTGEFNMLVGDGKQAIYRWRGGEVEQFSNLPSLLEADSNPLIKSREASLIRNYVAKELTHNRRSKREIVEFNNDFFRFVVAQDAFPDFLRPIYSALHQEFEAKNSGGAVSFHFLNEKVIDFDAHQATCQQVLRTIDALLADKYQLKDIAILTRNNRNGTELSSFLIDAGIPVISKESLLLSSSSNVNFMINVLEYLNNSQNYIARTAIMEHAVKLVETSKGSDLNGYFKSKIVLDDYLSKHFEGWNKSNLAQLPLYELCEELIRIFGLNAKADPYLLFFLDGVHSFLSLNSGSVADFMSWWERKKQKLSIVIPEGLNAVTVMTIHKSKGLEFPVVVFPYANWANKPGSEKLWVHLQNDKVPNLPAALLSLNTGLIGTCFEHDYQQERSKQELDDLNILYVAFTRAVERLYLICEVPDQHKRIGNYYVNYLSEKQLWQANRQDYVFGEFVPKVAKVSEKGTVDMVNLEKLVSNDWRSKLSLSQESEKIWNLDITSADKDYGNLIHTALSKIFVIADIPVAVQAMLAEGLIGKEEQGFLERKLNQLLSRKNIAPFFEVGLNCKTEAEIILPRGKTQRPDRIIFYPEKAVVLDYKTGVELEKHKAQIAGYASTLSQMGYSSVETYLLYTETEKLIQL